MKRENFEKLLWLGSGMAAGLVALSVTFASVPKPKQQAGRVTNDTALYQNLSEIRVAKERDLNFDSDIARLSRLEGRYQERLSAPMGRINRTNYQASGRVGMKSARE